MSSLKQDFKYSVSGIFRILMTVCICYTQIDSYALKIKICGECCCEFLGILQTLLSRKFLHRNILGAFKKFL